MGVVFDIGTANVLASLTTRIDRPLIAAPGELKRFLENALYGGVVSDDSLWLAEVRRTLDEALGDVRDAYRDGRASSSSQPIDWQWSNSLVSLRSSWSRYAIFGL